MITVGEIERLHRRHAPTPAAHTLVYGHCQAVWDVARDLLERGAAPQADAELVRAGALLHDIGVYRLYDAAGTLDHADYLRHGVLGHELLAEQGFPPTLCRFASCHTGVGLTRADIVRGRLRLPLGDYVAETVEERLVMYADVFHTKSDPPRFVTLAAYREHLRRFGAAKVAVLDGFAAQFGEPALDAIAARHGVAAPVDPSTPATLPTTHHRPM